MHDRDEKKADSERAKKKPVQIRQHQKNTYRRHYLAEWLEVRDMQVMDLVRLLNEPEDAPALDKSQVYKWINKNQLPRGPNATRIAAALELIDPETGEPEPEMLMTHPAQDWIARKFRDRPIDDFERMKNIIENAFPDKTGTDG